MRVKMSFFDRFLHFMVDKRWLKYFDDAVEANQSNIDRMNKILVENNISSEDYMEQLMEKYNVQIIQ